MKSKPRSKSAGLAQVGKVILGAALLAVDKVREKLSQNEEDPKGTTKRAPTIKSASEKSPKSAARKKPAAKRDTSKAAKTPKLAAAAKPAKRKKAA